MKEFVWNDEDHYQWLNLEDAIFAHNLVPTGAVCLEIGVWKGGWILSLLTNEKSRSAVCVDPYPNLEYIKDIFLGLVNDKAPNRVTLISELTELDKRFVDLKFDVVHLDGEHSQGAMAYDLLMTVPKLKDEGLLIVDDIFYHDFPGVTAALFQSLDSLNLAPFLFSRKKLYLCNIAFYPKYYRDAKALVLEMGIDFSEDQALTLSPGPYIQSNSINGFSLIIVNDSQIDLSHTRKILKIRKMWTFKEVLKQILPPFLLSLYRKSRK